MLSDHQLLQFNSLVRHIYSSLNLQELCVNALTGLQHLIPYHCAAIIHLNPHKNLYWESSSIVIHSFNQPRFEKYYETFYSSPTRASQLRSPATLDTITLQKDPLQYQNEYILGHDIHHTTCIQIYAQELRCGELMLHRIKSQQNFTDQERFILKLLNEHINSCFSHFVLPQLKPDTHYASKKWELSRRESQIASLILQGKTNKQIAQDLGVSENTIKTIMKRLYHKMKVHSRSELMRELYALSPVSPVKYFDNK